VSSRGMGTQYPMINRLGFLEVVNAHG